MINSQTKVTPRPPLRPMIFPNISKSETVIRIDTWREDTPRKYRWQFWLPKYGKTHILAMTKKGVYDITNAIEEQL